jgi:hypothetical protein
MVLLVMSVMRVGLLMALMLLAMGASRAAGLGAGPQSFGHDLLNGPRAAAALGAAAQTAIDLPSSAREVLGLGHNVTHVVVGQDVAGTNNHGMLGEPVRTVDPQVLKRRP